MASMFLERVDPLQPLCAIGIGGNYPETEETISDLQTLLLGNPHIFDLRFSKTIRTLPDSPIPQPPFLNCAAIFTTDLDPYTLFAKLEEVEVCLGKKKKEKEWPRLIDIDLLIYGDQVIEEPELILPHPRMFEREFVLLPLMELVDEIQVGKKTIILSEYFRQNSLFLKGKKI